MAAVDYNYPFSLHSDGTGVDQPARDAANAAQLTANQALAASQALSHVYATTAAAQADAALPNGSFYTVSNTTTKQLDLYSKTDSTTSVYQFSLAQATQTNINTAALATINEVVSPLTFTATPPAGTDPYTEVFTTISLPDTRWTKTIVSGALQIAQSQIAVLCYGIQHKTTTLSANMVIEAEFAASALSSSTAYGISLNDTTTFDASHGRQIQVRANGATQAVWGSGAGLTTGITITGMPALPYAVGDVVILRLVTSSDPTAGTLYVIINGEVLGTGSVTGLPGGTQYVGALVTQVGPATQATAKINRFQTHPVALDQIRWRSININGTGTDKGTEANPFLTAQSATRDFSDHPGRSAKWTLKGGAYRFPLVVPLKRFRELTIRAEKGGDPIIYGSTLVTSGWTLSTTAHVYYRTLVADGISGVVSTGVGGIIDLGAATDLAALDGTAWRAGQTIPYAIYGRLAAVNGTTVTLAAQLAAILPGQMFIDPGAGRCYVRPLADADPNTLSLEYCNRTAAFNMAWTATSDWNDCRLSLVGLHFKYAYNHVLWAQRAQVLIEECIAEGSCVGNAMMLDNCGGQVNGCEARYSYNDGLHSDAVDIPSVATKPKLHISNLHAHHFLLGDCVSNHEMTEHHIVGSRLEYAGKSGCAQIDNTTVVGTVFKGCAQYGYNTGANVAGCGSTVIVRDGTMVNTGGAAVGIDGGDLGLSTMAVDAMTDLGGNGTVSTGVATTIRGKPGDLGIARAATAANIAAVGNIVNTRGKAAGRGIREVDGSRRLLTADGPLPADPWRTADGVTTVTPV